MSADHAPSGSPRAHAGAAEARRDPIRHRHTPWHRHLPRWLRAARLSGLRARRVIRSNPHTLRLYRLLLGGLAGVIIVVGLILVPLPGPGWLIVFVGVALLGTEFHWARRLLTWAKSVLHRWSLWLTLQSWPVRGLVGAATLAAAAGVVWLVLLVLGVPHFVPAHVIPEWTGIRRNA